MSCDTRFPTSVNDCCPQLQLPARKFLAALIKGLMSKGRDKEGNEYPCKGVDGGQGDSHGAKGELPGDPVESSFWLLWSKKHRL